MDNTAVLDEASGESIGETKPPRRMGYGGFVTAVAGLVLAAWLFGRWGGFEPGSPVGYNLGVAGGVMMLLLFLYPLRKHVRFMHGLGPAKYWFAVHMAMGILGPLFILAHSRFQIGSINAGVAMASMCLVAGSGIIGRFIYTKIHHGLYGRRASLDEVRARAGFDSQELQSRLAFAPDVEAALERFGQRVLTQPANLLARTVFLASLGFHAWRTQRTCARQLRHLYGAHAKARGWDQRKQQRRLDAAARLVTVYLRSMREVAHFSTYERLFSLWHVLHVPLVYMLVLSAIAHVVAVHMY